MACLTFRCGHPKSGRNAMPRNDGVYDYVCCRICKAKHNAKWRKNQPLERWRKQKRRLRKGRPSPLLKSQNGRCAICTRKLAHPYEDHNHETGERRGLLCPSCNSGLHIVESKKLLLAALKYLKNWHA